MKISNLKLERSTRYDAKVVSVPHGIRVRPLWTILITCIDRHLNWRDFDQLCHRMTLWCDDNLVGHRCHYRGAMSGSLEAVTFSKYSDAMLFYIAFV